MTDTPKETNEILLLIWQEMKSLNGRIDQTNSRLDQTNSRLDQTNSKLDHGFRELRQEFDEKLDALRRHMVESDVRLATLVTELSGDVRSVAHALRDGRPELTAHGQRITQLEERVESIEGRLPRQ